MEHIVISQLPTYLSNVLRYSLSFNGLLSSLCFLFQWLVGTCIPYLMQCSQHSTVQVCLVGCWATDLVRARNILPTLTIRKINTVDK